MSLWSSFISKVDEQIYSQRREFENDLKEFKGRYHFRTERWEEPVKGLKDEKILNSDLRWTCSQEGSGNEPGSRKFNRLQVIDGLKQETTRDRTYRDH